MAANLLQDAGAFLGPDTFGRLGDAIGETPETTRRAATASLPALLGGVSELGRHEPGRVMGLIRSNHYDDDASMSRVDAMLHDRPDGALANEGHGILQSLFGGRLTRVIDGLSATTGMGRSQIAGLLAMLAPVALGVIGKRVHDDRLDTNGLATLLDGQRASLRRLVPDGVASALGLGAVGAAAAATTGRVGTGASGVASDLRGAVRRESDRTREAVRVDRRERRGAPPWLWALIALAALVLLGVFLYRAFAGRESREIDRPAIGATGESWKPGEAAGGTVAGGLAGTRETAESAARGAAPVAGSEAATRDPSDGRELAPAGAAGTTGMGTTATAEGVTGTGTPSRVEPAQPGVDGLARALASDAVALPARFLLDDLRFDYASSDIRGEPRTIQVVSESLRSHPTARIRVEGHTDSTGDAGRNRALAEERAAAVRDAIVATGVETNRIEVAGYGSERPVANQATEDGRAQNRRTEIVLIER